MSVERHLVNDALVYFARMKQSLYCLIVSGITLVYVARPIGISVLQWRRLMQFTWCSWTLCTQA